MLSVEGGFLILDTEAIYDERQCVDMNWITAQHSGPLH